MSGILVTGGAGYIGSHTVLELLAAGHRVTVMDNLSNAGMGAVRAVERLAGKPLDFRKLDLRDRTGLERLFADGRFDAVIHFAGLKAVGESVEKPLAYYDNNVCGTVCLLEAMRAAGVKNIVFSSSATVYGAPETLPIPEDAPLSAANPYGRTKLMIEEILGDVAAAWPALSAVILRYFNPVGAHESGEIGEDPNGVPNNLMPYISQVAVGKLERLRVFGGDYGTPDGTGVRDYIHVVDLARGHICALAKMDVPGLHVYNLGTGNGYSVLEVVRAFERASGKPVPYEITARRAGDVAACYADPAKARAELGFCAEYGIDRMCADVWRWQSAHPDGYPKEG